jgi:hypothetical protein
MNSSGVRGVREERRPIGGKKKPRGRDQLVAPTPNLTVHAGSVEQKMTKKMTKQTQE